MGPPRRKIIGKEYEHLMLLIKMSEPIRESNNQRTSTEEYYIGGKYYDVTYGWDDEPELEEVEYNEEDLLRKNRS